MQELKNPSKIDDVEYKDKLRFSHGDSQQEPMKLVNRRVAITFAQPVKSTVT